MSEDCGLILFTNLGIDIPVKYSQTLETVYKQQTPKLETPLR